jgi:hypothetical protein
MRRVFVGCAVGIAVFATAGLPAPQARAQSWAESVLPERSFDAGTVARGSKVRHTFRLVNRLDQEVHISTWQTKCGCTEVRVGARVIPPGTQTTIEAVIDTTKFLGHKPSGLTLILDRPSYAAIDLNLSCYIRGDLTINPGVVDFGIVSRAAGQKSTVSVALTYAGGQANWGVTRMQTQSDRVSAKLQEQGRSPGGQVQYLLSATFDPSQLSGPFKDEITLYPNDGGQPIPIAVSAAVQSALTVAPSPLVIGQVKPGQVLTKTLLVRSTQPFKLSAVKPSKDDLTAAPPSEASAPASAHTVSLTFKAPTQPGPFNATIEIETDLKGEPPVKINAFANVVP